MELLTFSSEEFDSKHYETNVYLCEQCVYHGNNLALERWFLLSTMIFNLDKLGQKLTSMFRSNSYEKKSFSVQFFFEIEIVVLYLCLC